MRQIISYLRVSTGKQGKCGLGIESQREAIARFAAAEGFEIAADAPVEDVEYPYRLNPLLALKLHLEWLMNLFAEQPGVSVSIR